MSPVIVKSLNLNTTYRAAMVITKTQTLNEALQTNTAKFKIILRAMRELGALLTQPPQIFISGLVSFGICLDFSEFSGSWSLISLVIIDFNKLKLLFYEIFNCFIYFASDLLPYYRIVDF